MKAFLQHCIIRCRERDGFALFMVLLILAALTLLGLAALSTSKVDIQISGNDRQYKTAFYASESGIEVGCSALNDLKGVDSGSWDRLLTGAQNLDDYIDSTGNRNVGRASFTLQVRDNDDLDGTTLVDSDNIVILTSTSQYENARVIIETTVRYTGGADQFAQEHYDTDSSGKAATESEDVSNNVRWN